MLCKKPFKPKRSPFPVPCGQCMHCRFNKRRVWANRMVLETSFHAYSAFVTLTYSEEALNDIRKSGRDPKSLQPEDAQSWLKRLRAKIDPHRIRFYLVGEYGDQTQRPHFHAAVFGLPTCIFGRSRYEAPYNRKDCCPSCDLVRDTWGKGRVHLDQLNQVTASYIAGYIAKKWTKKSDPRLAGRHPEFARMSLRPGIGFGIVEQLSTSVYGLGKAELEAVGDVPSSIRVSGKNQPLGRYLKEKLRVSILQKGVVLDAPGFSPKALRYYQELTLIQKEESKAAGKPLSRIDAILRRYKGARDAHEAREQFRKKRFL